MMMKKRVNRLMWSVNEVFFEERVGDLFEVIFFVLL